MALMLPAELAARVNLVAKDLSERYSTRVSTASPHITLIPPFDATKSQLGQLKADLKKISKTQAPFEVNLKGFNAFPKRVLYVDVANRGEVGLLKGALDVALARSCSFIPASRGKFVPHVSIASKKVQKTIFDEAWGELQNKEFEACWRATQLTILLFEDGKQWVEAERFSLQGQRTPLHS